MRLISRPVSEETFSRLAAGGGGAGAMAELRAMQCFKNRLLIRELVLEARTAGHPHADLSARAYDLMVEMETHGRGRVESELCYPAVGAWALRTYLSLKAGTGVKDDPGRLAALVVAVAVRSQTACQVRLALSDDAIVLPGLGRLSAPAGARGVFDVTVRPDGEGAELDIGRSTVRVDPLRDDTGWQVLRRLPVGSGFSLVVDDADPYRWPAGHVTEPRLSDAKLDHWARCLREAWRVLTARHWTVAEEMTCGVSVLTPIHAPAFGQNSATSRETFGTVALSEPQHGLGMAATFAHEIQHAKLTALTGMVDLTRPENGRRHYAPWRNDPRPVNGLLQGAYAYLGVAGFWRRQHRFEQGARAFRGQVEFTRWREAAHRVTGTLLACGGLNDRGEEFVKAMRGTLERWLDEPVDLAVAAQARREADQHLRAWTRRNSRI
ncbi:HEXXH motif domain-containing protein [Streptosporangium sp. NBC_01755]|uniref:HEXXH motif domain-containing protein n=1 Tax=Streptosporangium sp. NBC_01755 TaxID=2975949 RepID=UPI002DD825A1|nr:HEXXH motif domain-containing protein [Streptosporangium sp. NBC_01755]WSD00734.1 HEXXH motif domain-containing protein [Streptosporangium sp. NBC_01755]